MGSEYLVRLCPFVDTVTGELLIRGFYTTEGSSSQCLGRFLFLLLVLWLANILFGFVVFVSRATVASEPLVLLHPFSRV